MGDQFTLDLQAHFDRLSPQVVASDCARHCGLNKTVSLGMALSRYADEAPCDQVDRLVNMTSSACLTGCPLALEVRETFNAWRFYLDMLVSDYSPQDSQEPRMPIRAREPQAKALKDQIDQAKEDIALCETLCETPVPCEKSLALDDLTAAISCQSLTDKDQVLGALQALPLGERLPLCVAPKTSDRVDQLFDEIYRWAEDQPADR